MSPIGSPAETPQNSPQQQSTQPNPVHELAQDPHHLAPANSVGSYPPGPYVTDNLSFKSSFNHNPNNPLLHYGQDPSLGIYPGPESDALYHTQPYHYSNQSEANHNYATVHQPYPNQQILASSPSSTQSGPRKRKRREASASASSTPKTKATKSQSPRKDKKRKQANKAPIPKLAAPLSQLTKNDEHIPIKDMSQWVNRDLETRRAENSKRVGYVTRPMNSFMLYRSAYSERTKNWCKQNNHQVVSTVSGQSWPMEPKEIRDEFAEYARIERENHALANPDYRFRPHKAKKSKKSQDLSDDDLSHSAAYSEDDEDDEDEETEETTRPKKRAPKALSSRHLLHEEGYADEGDNGRQRSTFHHSNPGMAAPLPLDAHNLQGHYLQTTVKANMRDPNYVEDLTLQTKGFPGHGSLFLQHAPLSALPGGTHHMLLSRHTHRQGSVDSDVDPVLYSYPDGLISPTTDSYSHIFRELDRECAVSTYYPSIPAPTNTTATTTITTTTTTGNVTDSLYHTSSDPYPPQMATSDEAWHHGDEDWYLTHGYPKLAK